MAKFLYVLGGRQRREQTDEWSQYDQAIILRIDLSTRKATVAFRYESPQTVASQHLKPSILFKSGSLDGDILYACTQTEVLGLSLPTMDPCRYISHFAFNDLHHVLPFGDLLAVTSTGTDSVLLMSKLGRIERRFSTLPDNVADKFDPTVDYRMILTTKPHASHPNYCFVLDGSLWTTRFEQRDAIRLEGPRDRFDVGIERPHDGILHEGRIHFTTVDGNIVVFDARSRERLDVIDLNVISQMEIPLGWCRGLTHLERDTWLVGFSRIRRTQFRQAIAWVRTKFGIRPPESRESRIAAYDLRKRELLWEIPLEQNEMNVVFSMHLTDV